MNKESNSVFRFQFLINPKFKLEQQIKDVNILKNLILSKFLNYLMGED
jgi:hypothetical protein